jgi:hypothetical protein
VLGLKDMKVGCDDVEDVAENGHLLSDLLMASEAFALFMT